jgi:hypothetical protein
MFYPIPQKISQEAIKPLPAYYLVPEYSRLKNQSFERYEIDFSSIFNVQFDEDVPFVISVSHKFWAYQLAYDLKTINQAQARLSSKLEKKAEKANPK